MGLRPAAALRRPRAGLARGALPALLALVVLAPAGCAPGDSDDAAPAPSAGATPSDTSSPGRSVPPETPGRSGTPSPTGEPAPERFSTWPLGERVLPLRPDGYGEVRPTPPTLRERRYPTTDLLPPPPDGRFHATVGPVGPEPRSRLAWEPGCPVGLEDLRYLTVSFRGFDGAAHTGELVVAAEHARPLVSVFRALFDAGFPIEEMRLPEPWELDAPPTGDGNNTAAYVCRATTGQTSGWSQHAYGLAIDINPFQNPYLKGDLVLPELASSYLDRDRRRPGMVLADGPVVAELDRIGWSWGGAWSSLKDYQHFSATGR